MTIKASNAKINIIYKVVTAITLFVPLPLYLFLSATLFNIVPDYTIENIEINEIVMEEQIIEEQNYAFIYTNNTEVVYNGVVIYENGNYGFLIDVDDIVKVDSDFFSYNAESHSLQDIKKFEVQKQVSYKLPIVFMISLFGILIVVLIVQGKMDWYKNYPRISTLIALLTVTVIMYILNTIIGNMLNVFLIATISWSVYCLEYLSKKGIINKTQAEKEENDLISTLKNALK